MKKGIWFEVWLYGECIDEVFYTYNMTCNEVYKSLVEHDGYDSNIEVRKTLVV